jgi:hypothetical protein
MSNENIFQRAMTEALFNDLRRANSEEAKKQRFIQYITKTFSNDPGAQLLISAITLGAERIIANIPRGSRVGIGKADNQTETIIIEWEKDLTKTGEHARQQLEEYLAGNWRSGQEYRFVLIATDGVKWRMYAPDWSHIEIERDFLAALKTFELREIRRFDLDSTTFDEFPFFLDEILFASQPKSATLESIQGDFGDTSATFINSIAWLKKCAGDIYRQSELKVAFDEWRRFLSIAYGRFDNSPSMFLVHTYLSVFAKLIAYSVITRQQIGDETTIREILSGKIFHQLNIERFVEDDFFHWVWSSSYFKQLRPMYREIIRKIQEYDFSKVKEDILKGVYQELIDLETRHALGEYYTPDWLCERIVGDLQVGADSHVLDPACGSGSFLRAIIAEMRRASPRATAESLAERVVGIDIHPLSVLISKATLLLALGDKVKRARRPIILQVYLANSLLVPRGTADLFVSTFQITVDNASYSINVKGIESSEGFDNLVAICDELAQQYSKPLGRKEFIELTARSLPDGLDEELPGQLYEIYRAMKKAQQDGRDSIWKFILQNSYKPVFLMKRFDFVVGNPPWLTYADMSNGEYQALLRTLSDFYSVTPASKANMPHLEIAAIFFAHSVNYFLKDSGKISFVLPRSFMSADQHENTRSGKSKGMRLTAAWDLEGVSPLFNVPACVFFAVPSSEDANPIPSSGIDGLIFKAKLPRSQLHWDDASDKFSCDKTRWYYSRLVGSRGRTRSALTQSSLETLKGANAYETRFNQGATIVPRNFFFVDIDQPVEASSDLKTRIISIKTSDAAEREAQKPWKGNILAGRAEGSLVCPVESGPSLELG